MARFRLNISARILLIVAAAVTGMAILGLISLDRLYSRLLEDRKDKAQQLTEVAHGLIAGYHARARAGEFGTEEAQRRALAALEPLRYGSGDYFWVNDMRPVMIRHPNQKLNGQDLSGFKDPTGKPLFLEMVEVVRRQGGGFVPYLWPKPGFERPVGKISYVKGFAEWGWVVGTGIYLDDLDTIFQQQARLLLAIVAGIMVVVAGMSFLVSRGIVLPVRAMTAAMGRLAAGDLEVAVPAEGRRDEIGDMARAVGVFKDNAVAMAQLRQERARERAEAERQLQEATRAAEQALASEIAGLAEAFSAGDLDRRMSAQGKEGMLLAVSRGINHLADTVEAVIADLDQALDALAQGNLERRITNAYQGRFEKLKDDFNQTSEQLAEIVGQIHQAADIISSAASEVSAGSGDLAERTEQQASSLEQTAAAMEELSATVRSSAENATRADQMALVAREAAEKGEAVAISAIQAMTRIAEASRRITDIIGVIDEIAFQTNLLALNAAVEAARAGDAGKGFAVVAQEVRVLAQRAAQASKQIKGLILDSDTQVRSGVEMVRAAGDSLAGIVSGVQQVAAVIGEMATAAHEQASALDEINSAVAGMDDMTQKNAALVEQTSAAAASVASQTVDLRHRISFFQIRETG